MEKQMKCNCCANENLNELDSHKDYRHFQCVGCGYEHFVRLESTIQSALYENDADYIDDLNVLTTSDDLILWHHLKAINFLRLKFQSRGKKTLDVGCFNGFFVKKMLSFGFDAHGVDFNKSAISYGQKKLDLAARITTKNLEELFEEGHRFDVVTLFEVLEHLPDAADFLFNITKLLNNGGVLIISTPNNKMCWRPALDYPPHHLSRFTTKSLFGYLSQLNMAPLYSAEQMSSYELIRHYVGTFFRSKDSTSMRGGEFKNKKLTTLLRRAMNKMRHILGIVMTPLDMVLHFFGVRYISQIVIAEKKLNSK